MAISSIWPNLTGQYRGRAEERRTGDWFEFGFREDSPKGGTGPPKLDKMFWSAYQCGLCGHTRQVDTAARISDHVDSGSPPVRGRRLAGV